MLSMCLKTLCTDISKCFMRRLKNVFIGVPETALIKTILSSLFLFFYQVCYLQHVKAISVVQSLDAGSKVACYMWECTRLIGPNVSILHIEWRSYIVSLL